MPPRSSHPTRFRLIVFFTPFLFLFERGVVVREVETDVGFYGPAADGFTAEEDGYTEGLVDLDLGRGRGSDKGSVGSVGRNGRVGWEAERTSSERSYLVSPEQSNTYSKGFCPSGGSNRVCTAAVVRPSSQSSIFWKVIGET